MVIKRNNDGILIVIDGDLWNCVFLDTWIFCLKSMDVDYVTDLNLSNWCNTLSTLTHILNHFDTYEAINNMCIGQNGYWMALGAGVFFSPHRHWQRHGGHYHHLHDGQGILTILYYTFNIILIFRSRCMETTLGRRVNTVQNIVHTPSIS